MSVVLHVVPFFLAARVAVEPAWKYGPVYTFQVQVNSTAIPVEGSYVSLRLNVASTLVCQPKGFQVLSCNFRDSKADSYAAESLDPGVAAVPIGRVSRQEAYEINEDQFEIKFNEQGLDSLVVNEDIQPRELDMIRAIVGQLHIGNIVGKYDQTFELMENFTQGECVTVVTVERDVVSRDLHRNYVLETVFDLQDEQLVQIRKIRDLRACTHKIPYFFGSAESMSEISDVVSDVSSLESQVVITTKEFLSGTMTVVRNSKLSDEMSTTLYENIRLRLESISPAEGEPPEVNDPEPASIFIGRWLIYDSEEDSMEMHSTLDLESVI